MSTRSKLSDDERLRRSRASKRNYQRRRIQIKVAEDPKYVRRANLWRRYKITLEDFELLLKSQGYRCAICDEDGSVTVFGWVVDHDHDTGQVRGILCHHCNLAIGHTRESVGIAQRLVEYLEHHNGNH